MKLIITNSYEESCKYVAQEMVSLVNANPVAKLGLATGGTAEQVYPHLVKAYQDGKVDFSNVTTVNLDEYLGMSPDNPVSYRKCMDNWFFDHVNIKKENTYVASGLNDPQAEIKTFNQKLYGDKLLDFQLLGVGVSGHIGFNEPSAVLTAGVHIEELDESTIQANSRYFDSPADVPTKSITMGAVSYTHLDVYKRQTYVFDGAGWGHQLGMSQFGANAMAREGFDYDEILKFYFPGVQVDAY